jgi:ABC-type Fe3+/spermidine/putrescine transport system ATPase subunit
VVGPLDLDIAAGDFFAILGPSGCGKTTFLRMLAGFVAPSGGKVRIGGADVTRLGPERRPTNMVFQSYGLFPHMTVRQNVAFGLTLRRRLARSEIRDRVDAMLALARLEALAERGVGQLSGGQQQRVALARALVLRPQVLLLDEPLSALDLKLRQTMQEELRRLHREIGGTFVFVTHDQGEALALASRVAVMNAGRLEQVGAPAEVYHRPRSTFVATFVGDANLLEGRRRSGQVEVDGLAPIESAGPDGPVRIVVRPERVTFAAASQGGLALTVTDVLFAGNRSRVVGRTDAGLELRLDDPSPVPQARVGQRVTVGWRPEDEVVLDDAT